MMSKTFAVSSEKNALTTQQQLFIAVNVRKRGEQNVYECAETHSSVASDAELRTGAHLFDPWLGQYSFRGLIIVIVTGFIHLYNCCQLF